MLVQGEIATHALRPDGSVAWRVPHSDVIVEAELLGGKLVLTGYGGTYLGLDALTGAEAS